MELTLKKYKPYISAMMTDASGKTQEARWLIDTGASHALSVFHQAIQLPDSTIDTYLGTGLNGDLFGKLGRLDQFCLEDFCFDGVITGFPEQRYIQLSGGEDQWYGNIGGEILSRFKLIIDYPHGKLFLRKAPAYDDDFYYNNSGLELEADGEQFNDILVSYVRKQSPAWLAGVRPGDRLLRVNAIGLMGLNLPEVQNQLGRKPGKKLRLRIKRGEEILKITFVINEEI